MTRLLVATANPKKLLELKGLLADLPLQLVCLKDIAKYEEVPEDGSSFQENAAKKALGYAHQTGLLTLAKDSGLCCDALEGAPGIYSARFAGPGKNDRDNNLKLLRLLEKVPDNCRGAHFISAVAVAEPGRLVGAAEGTVHGIIDHQIRGTRGFGYDPVFYYPPFAKTFGEVPMELKHQVSHRSRALKNAKGLLQGCLSKKGEE